jgi:hypothetical protein
MDTSFLYLSEVFQEIGLTRRDVRRLIECGQLPGYRFKKYLQVKSKDLLSFVKNSKVRSVSAGVSGGSK